MEKSEHAEFVCVFVLKTDKKKKKLHQHLSSNSNSRCALTNTNYTVFLSPLHTKQLLTLLGLVPHDALQIDAGSRLTGPQAGRIPFQGS